MVDARATGMPSLLALVEVNHGLSLQYADPTQCRYHLEEAVRHGNVAGAASTVVGNALAGIAASHAREGNPDLGVPAALEALRLYRNNGDTLNLAIAVLCSALIFAETGHAMAASLAGCTRPMVGHMPLAQRVIDEVLEAAPEVEIQGHWSNVHDAADFAEKALRNLGR